MCYGPQVQGPFRQPPGTPSADSELERLAMQGQMLRAQLAAGQQVHQQSEGANHLRIAIGGYRGSALKRIMLAVILLFLSIGLLGFVAAGLEYTELALLMIIGGSVMTFVLFMVWVFIPPRASAGAVAAEQAWARSLPFALRGYFELLSGEPSSARAMSYEIAWHEGIRLPEPHLVQGVFYGVDPDARLEHADARRALVRGGNVSGNTGIRMNGRYVYRNHRLPARVHAVVEQVLLPLHRSHPIASVTLRT